MGHLLTGYKSARGKSQCLVTESASPGNVLNFRSVSVFNEF